MLLGAESLLMARTEEKMLVTIVSFGCAPKTWRESSSHSQNGCHGQCSLGKKDHNLGHMKLKLSQVTG